jgi:hypothetical protein
MYQAQYTIPQGDETVSNCGEYTLQSFILEQGLYASYFTNRWLLGTPHSTQVDSQINFHWEKGNIGSLPKSDMVSVEWNGFMTVPVTGFYIFTVHVNDGVKLFID